MKFKVSNMNCIHCQNAIKKALNDLGVKKIKFNLEEKIVTIGSKKVEVKDVVEAVANIGYDFELI